jgi:hypothetical protein
MNAIPIEDHERIIAGLKAALDKALAENAANYAAAKNEANNTQDSDCSPLFCECINWCRDGRDMISPHHPQCEHYTTAQPKGSPASDCYAFYRRPVRQVDGVTTYAPSKGPQTESPRVYWKYRRGGYNPADGSYGRCMTYEEAKGLIQRHNATVEQPPGQRYFDTPPSI